MRMNKTMSNLVLGLIFCLTVIYSGCVSEQTEGERITELTDIDKHTITKVSIRNGMNGELTTTNDRLKIEELIDQLDRYPLKIKENQESVVGYRYSIDFFSDSNKISRITIVGPNKINADGIYYDVIDSPIDLEAIDELVDSM